MKEDDWEIWGDDDDGESGSSLSSLSFQAAEDDRLEREESKNKKMDLQACIANAQQQLRNFQVDLADEQVRKSINASLACTSFGDFMLYYNGGGRQNRKLRDQTITSDLHRMDYTVLLSGKRTCDKDEILKIYQNAKWDELELWGLANQSLYSGILLSLHRSFLKPELCVTLKNSSSVFILDLDASTLFSTSKFVLGCDAGVGAPLQLASFEARVTVNLKERTVSQEISRPTLSQIFDDELRHAAENIVDTTSGYAQDDRQGSLRLDAVVKVSHVVAENIVRGIGALVGADQDKPLSFRELAEEAEREQQRKEQQRSTELEVGATLFGWGNSLLSSLSRALSTTSTGEDGEKGEDEPLQFYHRDAGLNSDKNKTNKDAVVEPATMDISAFLEVGSAEVVSAGDVSELNNDELDSAAVQDIETAAVSVEAVPIEVPVTESRPIPVSIHVPTEIITVAPTTPAPVPASANVPLVPSSVPVPVAVGAPVKVRPVRIKALRAAAAAAGPVPIPVSEPSRDK